MNSRAASVKDAGRPRTLRSVAEAQISDGTILGVHEDLPRPAFLDVVLGDDILREREALQQVSVQLNHHIV